MGHSARLLHAAGGGAGSRRSGDQSATNTLSDEMPGGWLNRMRWRRRGAWMWPAFAALTLIDAVVGNALPPSGETQSLLGGALIAIFLNLLALVLLCAPVGAVLRRFRRDLPRVVARDYAGTAMLLCVSAGLLVAGLVHRPTVLIHEQALRDALLRAEAYIGDRAPAQFRVNVARESVVTIEPGSIYRVCVRSVDGSRTFCVIVRPQLPLQSSVRFDGYEPNSVFSQGTG